MSGHSKWATTKHKKAVVDAKRGKLFAKLIKNVEVASRTGGADPAGNPTLYDAIQKAKKNSVPNENIDRAVRRGGGLEGGGAAYEAITYEGYAPGGVAILVQCLTDNKNRAASDVRTALTRNGGSMADPGSVSYLFHRKGVVIVGKGGSNDGLTEDDLLVAVLIECLTDNRNRAASDVRIAMTRNGGAMADPGSVSYLFSRKGVVTLDKNGLTEDDVLTDRKSVV